MGKRKEEDATTRFAVDLAEHKFGWNQSDFAKELGVDPQHITNWLSRRLPPERHARVASTLGITVDELLNMRLRTDSKNNEEKQAVEPKRPFPLDAEFQVLMDLWPSLDSARKREILRLALGELRRPGTRPSAKSRRA